MLETNFLGLKLKNPLIVAAGPWSRDGNAIVKAIRAGAGAVVTESVVSDTLLDVRPRIAMDDKGAQNIRLYSDMQVEAWEEHITLAKDAGGVVIGSVSGSTPSELAYLAEKLQKYGCDAIEISVSNPTMESLEVVASHPDVVYDMTKEVVDSVDIPVMVKLTQTSNNIAKVAKAVKAAGGSGVSAINTVRGILGVDIETATPTLRTYGGISGEYIRPLGLASVATIAQTVDIPVCGVGGILESRHALEYMMLGASAVQMGTAVMQKGYDIITKVSEGIDRWADLHNISSVDEIRGRALANMKSFDEMKVEPAVSTADSVPCEENCSICFKACVYDAISRDDESVDVDQKACTGCGVCTYACPSHKLSLKW